MSIINASRSSHTNFIKVLEKLTCSGRDSCGGWFSVIMKDFIGKGSPCFPFAIVSRPLPIERDGWERGSYVNVEVNATGYEVDVYITYRVNIYGKDAEMLALDLQQLFLRRDAIAYLEANLGGRLIRTSDVRTISQSYGSDYVNHSYLDFRLGFVDVVEETPIECADLRGIGFFDDIEYDENYVPEIIGRPDFDETVVNTELGTSIETEDTEQVQVAEDRYNNK